MLRSAIHTCLSALLLLLGAAHAQPSPAAVTAVRPAGVYPAAAAPGETAWIFGLSGVAPERTLAIGDSQRDLRAARAAGMDAALVRTGKGAAQEADCAGLARWVFDDLKAAAAFLLQR